MVNENIVLLKAKIYTKVLAIYINTAVKEINPMTRPIFN